MVSDMSKVRILLGLLCVLTVLLSIRTAGAQRPAEGPSASGFTNPDSTRPVRAYRLPTWHWSTWTLRARGRATRTEQFDADSDRAKNSYDTRLSLRPTYRSLWERERRQAFLRLSPALSVRRGARSSGASEAQETDTGRIEGSLNVRGTIREYGSGRGFLLAEGDGALQYRYGQTARATEPTETTVNVGGRANLRLGGGVGRVRVVTPVIRALRVRERLRAVAPGTSLSDRQVQTAAKQLARRPGYESVYDRPDRFFWRDFFDQVGLSDRSAFETYYVADVLREPVGVRREGADLAGGPTGSYRRNLRRTEEDDRLVERSFSDGGTVGGFVRGRWYRNVTLHHQLGADVEATYTHFVDSQGPLDHEVRLDAEAQWLWVVADRVRLDSRLRADLTYRHDPTGRGEFQPRNQYVLSSDLVVFVENSVSVTAGANVRYRYDEESDDESRFRTGLQFRVNYVLSRTLR